MKPALAGAVTRAPSPLARGSLAARWAAFRAWARGSLGARLLAVAAGLAVLNVLGSAFAGKDAPAPPPPAPSSVPAPALPAPAMDAGPPPATPPPAAAGPPAARASSDDPVDLNRASLEDLRRLPGIGPKRAEAILAIRARLGGRFRQVEDLLKVKGIGRATLKRLRPLVRLDSPDPR